MWVFTCNNPDCSTVGDERLFDWQAVLDSNAADNIQTGPMFCGICGTDITDTGHAVPDNYVPKLRPPDDFIDPDEDPDAAMQADIERLAEEEQQRLRDEAQMMLQAAAAALLAQQSANEQQLTEEATAGSTGVSDGAANPPVTHEELQQVVASAVATALPAALAAVAPAATIEPAPSGETAEPGDDSA